MASRTADEVGPFTSLMRIVFKNILMHLCITLGLTGNILTLIVLLQKRMRRTSTTQYLAALTLFDSIYLISSFANNIDIIYPNTKQSDINPYLFLFFYPIGDFSSNTSVYLILMFTIERYLAVAYPLHSRFWCRPSRARKIIAFTILFCFLLTFPTILENKIAYNWDPAFNRTRPHLTETNLYPNFDLYKRIYFWIIAVMVQFIPLTILVILNSILMKYIHNNSTGKSKLSRAGYVSNNNTTMNNTSSAVNHQKRVSSAEFSAAMLPVSQSANLSEQLYKSTEKTSYDDRANSSAGEAKSGRKKLNSFSDETSKLHGSNSNDNNSLAARTSVNSKSNIDLVVTKDSNDNGDESSSQLLANTSLQANNLLSANYLNAPPKRSSTASGKRDGGGTSSPTRQSSIKSNRSNRSFSQFPTTDIRVHRNNVGQQQSEQHKATLLLVATVVVFLVCQTPMAILLIYDTIFTTEEGSTAEDIKLGLNNIANGLIAINASINFILYSCISEKFRQTFQSLFIFSLFKKNSSPTALKPSHAQTLPCPNTRVNNGARPSFAKSTYS